MDTLKIILNNQEKALLKKAGVSALVLFGSQAQGLAGPMSDFDFGVLLADNKDFFSIQRRNYIYDTLYDMLSAKIEKLANIDIVFLEQAPMELQSHTANCGIVVYEAYPNVFARFKEKVITLYADFEPLRNIFHSAILARIP